MIRLAIPSDAASCQKIAEAAYGKYVVRMGKKPAPMVADFANHIISDTVFILHEGEIIVGYAILIETSDGTLLDNIAIAENQQGKGLGRRLIDHVETFLLSRGTRSYELYTNIHMTENLTWYPALGFYETRRVTEKGFQRVYFRKDLSTA